MTEFLNMHNFLIIFVKKLIMHRNHCAGITSVKRTQNDLISIKYVWNIRHLDFKAPMEDLDQGSLHPSIKHPEADMSRPEFEPRPWLFTKELSRQLFHLTILIRYLNYTWEKLHWGAKSCLYYCILSKQNCNNDSRHMQSSTLSSLCDFCTITRKKQRISITEYRRG